MMQPDTQRVLFALVRSELSNRPLPESPVICDEEAEKLLNTAKNHDISNIVIDSAIRNGLIRDAKKIESYRKMRYLDTGRVLKIDFEQKSITETLEKCRIPYVILKGSVIRGLYPERWMRSSCDIDILVRAEDHQAAISALRQRLHYSVKIDYDMHSANLISPTRVHLELHHSILAHTENINRELKNVWDYVTPIEGSSFGYLEKPHYFVFHHLAHMYFHILRGGCGIRPFIDYWIIENKLEYDREKLDELLGKCDILLFRDNVKRLTDCWMNGVQPDKTETKFSEYIISGMLFGNRSNMIAAGKSYSGGLLRYILSRLIIPHEQIVTLFPWAAKHRFLLPLAQMKRWFFLLEKTAFGRMKKELHILFADEEKQKNVSLLLEEIGVHR